MLEGENEGDFVEMQMVAPIPENPPLKQGVQTVTPEIEYVFIAQGV